MEDFDVIIMGAGQASCSCALSLAKSGLLIGVFDKDKFPIEKTCGAMASVLARLNS